MQGATKGEYRNSIDIRREGHTVKIVLELPERRRQDLKDTCRRGMKIVCLNADEVLKRLTINI